MSFIQKYGRLIDTIGAALFLVLMVVSIIATDNRLLHIGFLSGALAFLVSRLIWEKRPDRDASGEKLICAFFALASAILFVIAAFREVLA